MYKVKCHCNKIEIEINQPKLFENLVRCNCSICSKRATVMAIVNENSVNVIKGSEFLKLYQFHTNTAKHYFCSECGIYTHHNPRSAPAMTGFNLGCVDEVNVEDLKEIVFFDG